MKQEAANHGNNIKIKKSLKKQTNDLLLSVSSGGLKLTIQIKREIKILLNLCIISSKQKYLV